MNQAELIEHLCCLLESAARIIRKQSALLAQHGMLDVADEALIEDIENYVG